MLPRNKTRLAPTPSGYLHLGNIISFIVTETLARQHGASVLLRIDDLDRERAEPKYVTDIIDTLRFFDLPYHEGPVDNDDFVARYSQVLRMPLYNQLLSQLAENGQVFACTCSRADVFRISPDGRYSGTCLHKQLPLDTPNATWRVNTSEPLTLNVATPAGRVTDTLPVLMDHFVVRKRNGFPAYQLSSVADDHHFGVDLIVRGQDLWESTMAQMYLAALLGLHHYQDALFYHHPLVMNNNGEKLSKSAGDTSVHWYREQGTSADEVLKKITAVAGLYHAPDWQTIGEQLVARYWPDR